MADDKLTFLSAVGIVSKKSPESNDCLAQAFENRDDLESLSSTITNQSVLNKNSPTEGLKRSKYVGFDYETYCDPNTYDLYATETKLKRRPNVSNKYYDESALSRRARLLKRDCKPCVVKLDIMRAVDFASVKLSKETQAYLERLKSQPNNKVLRNNKNKVNQNSNHTGHVKSTLKTVNKKENNLKTKRLRHLTTLAKLSKPERPNGVFSNGAALAANPNLKPTHLISHQIDATTKSKPPNKRYTLLKTPNKQPVLVQSPLPSNVKPISLQSVLPKKKPMDSSRQPFDSEMSIFKSLKPLQSPLQQTKIKPTTVQELINGVKPNSNNSSPRTIRDLINSKPLMAAHEQKSQNKKSLEDFLQLYNSTLTANSPVKHNHQSQNIDKSRSNSKTTVSPITNSNRLTVSQTRNKPITPLKSPALPLICTIKQSAPKRVDIIDLTIDSSDDDEHDIDEILKSPGGRRKNNNNKSVLSGLIKSKLY